MNDLLVKFGMSNVSWDDLGRCGCNDITPVYVAVRVFLFDNWTFGLLYIYVMFRSKEACSFLK